MKRLTQEHVVQCFREERLARSMHRKENSRDTWLELQHCIRETNYALKHYDVTMYGSGGQILPTAASIRRMAAMNGDARKPSFDMKVQGG